jgi:anti-sigma regulatory factor (Ser/Thr protein kinase)
MSEFCLRFRSSLGCLKAAEKLCSAYIEQQALAPEKRYWLILSIHELAINAVCHGNHEDEGRWVTVEMDRRRGMLEARITDEGRQTEIPHPADPTEDGNLFKNSGRGLFIVRHNVDALEFNLTPTGLQTVVRIALAEPVTA